MNASDIAYLSAHDLLQHYREHRLSPVDVAQIMLDRIDRYNQAVNAFVYVDPELTLGMARASERRWTQGQPVGPLDGVPVTMKDLVPVRGLPMRRGSRVLAPDIVAEDAPVAARLRESGAVFVAKTATPESGCKVVTESLVHGVTRNPFDLSRTPGGSSGGASAALALGVAPLAIGTDGAGSIRIPASHTNSFGLKPTFGRVPGYPVNMFMPHAVTGPMTRTVSDAALMLNVITRPDPRDPYALPYDPKDYREGMDDGVANLKIAFSATLGQAVDVDPEVAGIVAAAAKSFEEMGAIVEEVDPPWPCEPIEPFLVFWRAMYANAMSLISPEQQKLVDPVILAIVDAAKSLTLSDYHKAMNQRGAMAATMKAFHNEFDLLVTPVISRPPYPVGMLTPPDVPEDDWHWCPFTYPFNMTQQPASSVPCGFTTESLPVGLQVVGPIYGDALVLRASRAIEKAYPFAVRRPELVAEPGITRVPEVPA